MRKTRASDGAGFLMPAFYTLEVKGTSNNSQSNSLSAISIISALQSFAIAGYKVNRASERRCPGALRALCALI